MSDLLPVSIAEMIAELERELGMRRSVYPRQVAARKMSQSLMDRRIAIIEAAIKTLKDYSP